MMVPESIFTAVQPGSRNEDQTSQDTTSGGGHYNIGQYYDHPIF